MDLQLSTKRQEPAPAYENSPPQENTDIEMAHVSVNIYDSLQRGDRDEHTYGVAGEAAPRNAEKVRKRSEVTLSRSIIVLVVVGMILISTVISIISGVVVYHVTNGKITETSQEERPNTSNMTNMSQRLDALDKVIQALEGTLQTVQEKLNTSDQASRDYHTTMDDEIQAMQGILQTVQEKQNTSEKTVAFSVHTPHVTLTSDSTPTFRTIILNTGSYDMATGKFTCPVAGIYSFSLSLGHEGTDRGYVYCYYRVNGTHKSFVRAYYYAYDQSTGTMIVNLNVSDIVDLQCDGWDHVYPHSATTLSGVLITPS